MANDENSLIAELREDFHEVWPAGFWRKLHGSQYQTGLPDILAAHDYDAAMCEVKWITTEALLQIPLIEVMEKTLTALQSQTLKMLAANDSPLHARYLVGFTVEAPEVPHGEATFAAGFDLFNGKEEASKWTLADLAGIYLHAKTTSYWPDNTPHKIQAQLRCRGDQWRSAPLVIGLQRIKSI